MATLVGGSPITSAAPSGGGYKLNAAGQMVDAYGNVVNVAPFGAVPNAFRLRTKEGSDGGGTADGSSSDGAGDSGGSTGGGGTTGGGTDGSGGGDVFTTQNSAGAAAEQAAAAIQAGALFGLPRYSGTNALGQPYSNLFKPGADFMAKRTQQAASNENITNAFKPGALMPAWAQQQAPANYLSPWFNAASYFPGIRNVVGGDRSEIGPGTNLGFGTMFGVPAGTPGGGGGTPPPIGGGGSTPPPATGGGTVTPPTPGQNLPFGTPPAGSKEPPSWWTTPEGRPQAWGGLPTTQARGPTPTAPPPTNEWAVNSSGSPTSGWTSSGWQEGLGAAAPPAGGWTQSGWQPNQTPLAPGADLKTELLRQNALAPATLNWQGWAPQNDGELFADYITRTRGDTGFTGNFASLQGKADALRAQGITSYPEMLARIMSPRAFMTPAELAADVAAQEAYIQRYY
jgi:hypothetical protein